MLVGEICSHDVVVVTADERVLDAARKMRDEHVGCVIVANERHGSPIPAGILTDRDIVVAVVALNLEAEEIKVGDVMSEPALSVAATQTVDEALELMRANGVRRLPVVDEEGQLIGLVSSDDLLERLAGDCASLARMITREQGRERELRRVKV